MWKKILFILLLMLILGSLITGAWHFSSQIMFPKKSECSKDHFVYCKDPSELDLRFKDVSFKSKDGLTLKGWYIPATKKSNKAVVLVHGHGATRHAGLRWVKSINKAGFNILNFDLRNSGESDTACTTMGYYEKYDIIAALDYLEEVKGIKHTGVFGISMGGAAAIYAMYLDNRIEAGVFEASFADFTDLMADFCKRDYKLPRFPFVNLIDLIFEFRAKVDVDKISPEKVIGKIAPRPVFIIHCETDPYIPYTHGKRLYDAARDPKEVWTHSCTKHAEAWQADPAYIEKRVTDFYTKNMK